MSDSDDNDFLPSNIITFQNENTMISAKGPSVNSTNLTNFSFRNNVMTSTMNLPRNFERQLYGEQSFDQRSMYYRRETSPASMYSGSDMRPRNFNHSYYPGGMSSHRSMYNGRSGSPMSMRSMDSNASVSAADIALAFKNVKFNKNDLRMIKEAYNKFMKRSIRKKIEKRRNLRLFMKGYRRKSGYDSGEQGSDSSISSDDCKSTSSALYKDNMSSCRSTRTDITDFRRTIRDSNMYNDCTENFKQNSFRNMFSVPTANARVKMNAMNAVQNQTMLAQNEFKVPKNVPMSQKDRFRSGYLLPSQRFNKSMVSIAIPERDPRLQVRSNVWNPKNQVNNKQDHGIKHVNQETDSDQEEIFSEVTVREKSIHITEVQNENNIEQGKRPLEMEENSQVPDRKRTKLSSPMKQSNKSTLKEIPNKGSIDYTIQKNSKISTENNENSEKAGEFEFLKPQFPVRKSGPNKMKEKLISKSAPPLVDAIVTPVGVQSQVDVTTASNLQTATTEAQTTEEQTEPTQHSTSDMSMRPSFIKRKLFTQKMDVTEKKNLSTDAINVNSPQINVYSAIQREKHKARKVVTNQSCLSRDIVQDNNLLDLIHKIVPPDRMNVTNVSNKTSISTSVSSKNPMNDDKWDVASVISVCNNDDVSDTYTDEEIFAADVNKKISDTNVVNKPNNTNMNIVNKLNDTEKKINNNKLKPSNECRILVEKLPQNNLLLKSTKITEVSKKAVCNGKNGHINKSVYNSVKSFWDTDFESDMESPAPKRTNLRTLDVKENISNTNIIEEDKATKNRKTLNLSLASVSESIKSKTMPTNNRGKLKMFDISKNNSIKSYLTPKQNKAKPELIIVKEKSHKEECKKPPNKETEKSVKTTKQRSNVKSTKKTDTDCNNTNKKVNVDIPNSTNKKTESQPKKKAKSAQNKDLNSTTGADKSKQGRKVRTPKRNACCEESINTKTDKPTKTAPAKSNQKTSNKKSVVATETSLKTSLANASSSKSKAAPKLNERARQSRQSSKLNNSTTKKEKPIQNIVNIELKTDLQKLEFPPMNRTLRSRRIDLSSSINSSTDNVTIQIRSLRTRKVDLSNSLKNSSLDETIKKKTQKNPSTKLLSKILNTKKPRSVKNHNHNR